MDGPTDRPSYRDPRTHLKSVSETRPSRRAGFLALRSKCREVGKLSYILVIFLVFYKRRVQNFTKGEFKTFSIMFEFFCQKNHCKPSKKINFYDTVGNHILSFWTQCKNSQLSRSTHLRNTFFRCVLASLKEGVSVRPSVRPSVGWSVTRFF